MIVSSTTVESGDIAFDSRLDFNGSGLNATTHSLTRRAGIGFASPIVHLSSLSGTKLTAPLLRIVIS